MCKGILDKFSRNSIENSLGLGTFVQNSERKSLGIYEGIPREIPQRIFEKNSEQGFGRFSKNMIREIFGRSFDR